METLHEVARWLHVGIGLGAFASLWTAAFARKGGQLHRRAGTVYVWTMTIVLATAGVLTLTTLLRGNWMGAVVLTYLFTITGTSLWMGRRALRFKGNAPGYTRGLFLPVGVFNILSAAGVAAVGVMAREYFLAGISAIGFLIGLGSIAMSRRPPDHPRWWLKEHIGGMLGAGIATHIAFASIGLRQLFPQADTSVVTIWPWAVPLVVGMVAGALAERRYVKGGAPLPGLPDGKSDRQ